MRLIPVSDKFAIVDDEDFEKLSRFKWKTVQSKKGGKAFYAETGIRLTRDKGDFRKQMIRMQHFLIERPEGMVHDHINRNGLDNRKNNLRICTPAENNRNQDKRGDSSNKYRGVTKRKHESCKKKIWFARVRINGKRYSSKGFCTEEEAALAYNDLAKLHHGEFASLNVIK